uniref:coiled-coil domain-containing protein 177 n=1 Tax=Myxine glutinosa TaxID=7769 RepID=UPI00358FA292
MPAVPALTPPASAMVDVLEPAPAVATLSEKASTPVERSKDESPPDVSPGSERTHEDLDPSSPLQLDLDNFTSPVAQNSRYVLTSPRSLEACARATVRPVDLLPRDGQDFAVRGSGSQAIRVAYEEHDRERLQKLQACREIRNRIVRDQGPSRWEPVGEMTQKVMSPLPPSPPPLPPPEVEDPENDGAADDVRTVTDQGAETPSTPRHPPALRRTCRTIPWCLSPASTSNTTTTSDGGEGREGCSRGKVEVRIGRGRIGHRSVRERGTLSSGLRCPTTEMQRPKIRKATSEMVRHLLERPRIDRPCALSGRSFSLSDLSHDLNTAAQVEWLVVKVNGPRELPERDRKIAALMLARHQERCMFSEGRMAAHRRWEEERKCEEVRRAQEERERRRTLHEHYSSWERSKEARMTHLEEEQHERAALMKKLFREQDERWQQQLSQQDEVRRKRLEVAKREAWQRKRQQEQKQRENEQEEAALRERVTLGLQERLSQAEQKRLEREEREQRVKKMAAEKDKFKRLQLQEDLAKVAHIEEENRRLQAHEKLRRFEAKQVELLAQRDRELQERAAREDAQLRRAKIEVEKQAREQRQQREERVRDKERRLLEACQVAEESATRRAQRAVRSRIEKERAHEANRRRVVEEEEARQRERLHQVRLKERRSEQITREKEAAIAESRSIARASFDVREKVRQQTNPRSFDRMVFEAELQKKLL